MKFRGLRSGLLTPSICHFYALCLNAIGFDLRFGFEDYSHHHHT